MVQEKTDVRKLIDSNNLIVITGVTRKEQTLCARNMGIVLSKDLETKICVVCRKDDEPNYLFIDDVEFIPDISIMDSCIENTNSYIIIDSLCARGKAFLESLLYHYPNKVIVANAKCDMDTFKDGLYIHCQNVDIDLN